jgi:cathepsin F
MEGQHFLRTGNLVSLSEQQLMDCDTHSLDHGCHGGAPHIAFEWVINNTKNGNGGQTTAAALPYMGLPDATCPQEKGVATLHNWTSLSQNETEIAVALERIGPLSAGINEAGMEHYRGGVVCPIDDLCDPRGINHAVLIVGWGVDDGQEYWKIKNSWGAAYGEGGFYRICKGKGACGINKAVVAAVGA